MHVQATELTAYIHIGPHKTGSTHVQSFISDHAAELAQANVYWPADGRGTVFKPKRLSSFARALISGDQQRIKQEEQVFLFIKRSRDLNRNIIISAEALGVLNTTGVQALRSIFEGYQLRIIFGYRNPVSMMVSTHYELNKIPGDFRTTFATYLLETLSRPARHLQVLTMLDTFTDVVGMSHMYIIDLAGASQNGADITYVIICQIARIHCDNRKLFEEPSLKNSGSSLITKQVFGYFQSYLGVEKEATCRPCEGYDMFYQQFYKMTIDPDRKHSHFPVVQSSLHLLAPYAKEVDAALRAKYGARILHGNATANYEVIDHGIAVEDLDILKFTRSVYWKQWLENVYQWARNESMLCGCTM
jgi:hypothetical protein